MTPALLERQIEYLKEMGFGGFHMHSRFGMDNEYLSDEFMTLVRACTDKAKAEGMLAWLYDEDKWPSGFAGGLVTREPKFRQRRLVMVAPEDVVLALSHSGETDEVLKVVSFIHSNGNVLISITGNADSTLAKNSDIHLCTGVKEEACILQLAPTSSTTAQLAMGDALAVALMKAREFTATDFARCHSGGSLGRRLLMTVGNVMRRGDLPVVGMDCTATEMIHAMTRGGLGLIIICDGDKVEGIVTDGDLRRAMESRQSEFFSINAIDIASRSPKTISATAKLIEAEKMMTQNKVNSLLVTSDEGRLEGVIQIYDIKL